MHNSRVVLFFKKKKKKKNSDFLASAAIFSTGKPPMIAAINQLFFIFNTNDYRLFKFDKDLNFRLKCIVKFATKHTVFFTMLLI